MEHCLSTVLLVLLAGYFGSRSQLRQSLTAESQRSDILGARQLWPLATYYNSIVVIRIHTVKKAAEVINHSRPKRKYIHSKHKPPASFQQNAKGSGIYLFRQKRRKVFDFGDSAGWPYIVLDWCWFGEIDLFSCEYTSILGSNSGKSILYNITYSACFLLYQKCEEKNQTWLKSRKYASFTWHEI